MVFVDGVTASIEGETSSCQVFPSGVLQSMRREAEEKVLKMSIEKSKVIASCSCLEEKFQECGKSEGVGLATSVGTLECFFKENEAVGSDVDSQKEEVRPEVLAIGVRQLLRRVWGPCESVDGQDVDIAPTESLKLRRQMAAATGKEESVSLSLFMWKNNLEVEGGLIPPRPRSLERKACG